MRQTSSVSGNYVYLSPVWMSAVLKTRQSGLGTEVADGSTTVAPYKKIHGSGIVGALARALGCGVAIVERSATSID